MARPKTDPLAPVIVQVGNVRLRVRPWKHPSGRNYWRATYKGSDGRERDITRADREDAIRAAGDKAREIHNGIVDLTTLPQDKIRMIRAFLDLSPTWADLERWGAERASHKISIAAAIERFIAHKLSESADGETKHIKLTRSDLLLMAENVGPETPLARVRASALAEWLDDLEVGPKRKKDYRAACVALWRWAWSQDLIVSTGPKTEPEKLPVPQVRKKDFVRVLSVEELRFLFLHVRREFLPWLALSAFSGIRSGEIRMWGKAPLDWSMVKLDRRKIDLPPSLSKTGRRKLIPISDTLAEWLKELGPPAAGEVIPEPAFNEETSRLGLLLDAHFQREEGWPSNCLRHSFGSNRLAQKPDIAALAIEMDNSPAIIKAHYLEVRSEEEAASYFGVLPGTFGDKTPNYLIFSK